MRQQVTIAPLHSETGIGRPSVGDVEDLTDRFDREKRLAAGARQRDEAVRPRPAKALARGRRLGMALLLLTR